MKKKAMVLMLLFLFGASVTACGADNASDKAKQESSKDDKKSDKKDKDKKKKKKDKDGKTDKGEDDGSGKDAETEIPTVNADLSYADMSLSFYDLASVEWQFAYYNFLHEKSVEAGFSDHDSYWGGDNDIYNYALYDIDKNGIPELFVQYGNCEANYYMEVYSYDPVDYDMIVIEEQLWSGHTALATYPDDNGFLMVWGHMGSQYVQKATLDDDFKLVFDEIFEEDINDSAADYTPIDEIVLGSEVIDQYCFCSSLPILYYLNARYTSGDYDETAMATLFDDVMAGNTPFLQVNAYHFYSEPTELTSWSDFLAEGGANHYSASSVDYTADVDMNGDGQIERVVFLDNDTTVVLSYQDEMVYAYVMSYVSGQDVLAINDGSIDIENTYEKGSYRLIFDKNECYVISQIEWAD